MEDPPRPVAVVATSLAGRGFRSDFLLFEEVWVGTPRLEWCFQIPISPGMDPKDP
jgi:hypothetical protein